LGWLEGFNKGKNPKYSKTWMNAVFMYTEYPLSDIAYVLNPLIPHSCQ
jgi:hypothetical protein